LKKFTLALIALAVAAPAWSAEPAATAPAAAPTQEEVIAQFKKDLQAARADVMAKGMTLSADQAAKFWPLYEQYQKEQDAVIKGQITATQAYADRFEALSDADALAYVKALLDRDAKMNDLRMKWLAKFQDVVPPKVAARAIQLDRRLSQVMQVKVSSQIPLVP
jgi:Spy/CpxP family protein refolding chaperone